MTTLPIEGGASVAVTGASGYIGRAVLRRARAKGMVSTALSRRLSGGADQWMPYDLSSPPPRFEARMLIHLAYDRAGELTLEQESRSLLDLARARRPNSPWVFVSSQSAKNPVSNYGRRKSALETIALGEGAVVVRPGLVYGGRYPSGLAKQFSALSRLPMLPGFGSDVMVAPIHINALADALLNLHDRPEPRIVELGASPIRLEHMLRSIAEGAGRRPPIFVRIPKFAALMGAGILGGRLGESIRQMFSQGPLVDGLGDLGGEHLPPAIGAQQSVDPVRHALAREAIILSRALDLGPWTTAMTRRYIRTIQALGGRPLQQQANLPRTARAIQALGPTSLHGHMLAARLPIAGAIFESSPRTAQSIMRFKRISKAEVSVRLALALFQEGIRKIRGALDAVGMRPR